MHLTSHFSKLTRVLSLFAAACVISVTAVAQGPVKDVAGMTTAERKMDSALIDLTRASASGQLQAGRLQELPARVQDFAQQNVAKDQTIFVVIKGTVSPELTAFIGQNGGYDVSEFPLFDTTTAWVPITAVGAIAGRNDVQTIGPKEAATTNRYVPTPEELELLLKSRPQSGAMTNAGSVTWAGVTAHKANVAHAAGHTGASVKVCVLSDGVDSLAARQASGDLPAAVTVLSGQAGSGDEGTAMLEIVHDMAPGASLVFATAGPSVAQFATNILNLRNNAGCNIIVDDYTYFNEGAFQDGPIAQAVNTVTAAGAIYLSSAANSGNLTHGTSGTFEGDFVPSGVALPPVISTFMGGVGQSQGFGGLDYTTLTQATQYVSLKWSDPLGASGNDYDVVVTDSSATTILGLGTALQSGTQEPYELAYRAAGFPVGSRIYIVKYSGVNRAIRLDTNRGRIADGTTGSTFGHNAAGSGISVAAVNVGTAGGGAFTGGAANPVEYYSSDGPRKIFYQPNGTPITPGNVLFATNGGTTLQKVDLAAADCGTTTTPGFGVFCGTSAAAPTAAAIAALIKGANPGATTAQILNVMKTSVVDIEAGGWDRDSGVGIVMVPSILVIPSTYTIGGSVSGLGAGKSVGLLNNGGDALTVGTNGSFTFATAVTSGSSYAVTIGTQPAGQICAVTNSTGTVTANVTNVTVTCVNATYTIGGNVSGLGAGKSVGLLNNGGDALTVGANGSFTFATAVTSGNSYAVTIGTQPAGQICAVTSGTGTATANVTSVVVSCLTTTLTGNTSTGTGAATATLSGGGATCGFVSGSFVGSPAAAPAGVSFPHGFLAFTAATCPAAGGAVTITVTYPNPIPPGAQYYKYGKEPGNLTNHYYTVPATISGNQVTFTITDGQIGDDDVTANGTIIDPGAIGMMNEGVSNVLPVPTLSQYALMALAVLMFLAAGAQLGRRRS